ncbi:N-acetylmannosamine-6-phosphate 2-epimerase [Microbacterium sp. GCS4]|uniref:N-acetylmannosamine-6-phosphate 2-epimerase n=1 Tax=Microbacterium sp. GCS4 TaxID=1692239 RepID=UPI0006A47811|nr:N-acetylmannosamine-6-phosphate 2-epimerase [Microbacterium sp. GCS4]KNY05979.1 N-acetylmannosamine-6-phosphate 2-epimerase [Microbacterium sp. GCS4]
MTSAHVDVSLPARFRALRGGLVVSCQAYPGEPLRHPESMARIAQSAVTGGAVGIRSQGLDDIRAIAQVVDVPQIGLWKVGNEGVFITPTLDHALAVAEAGADVVAIDGTRRPRPDGLTLAETIARLKAATGLLVMADTGSVDDALAAEDAGADIVGTTLSGYTGERPVSDGPDLELVEILASRLTVPVFAEGRIRTPTEARAALDAGAYSVVVGTAITHPSSITSWFVDAITEA